MQIEESRQLQLEIRRNICQQLKVLIHKIALMEISIEHHLKCL